MSTERVNLPLDELARLLAAAYIRSLIASAELARSDAVSLGETPAFPRRNRLDSGAKPRPHGVDDNYHEGAQ